MLKIDEMERISVETFYDDFIIYEKDLTSEDFGDH